MTPNWEEIRRLFETSNLTLKDLAEQYGIKDSTIRSRKNRENWQSGVATQHNVATCSTESLRGQPADRQASIFIMEYLRDFKITRAAFGTLNS